MRWRPLSHSAHVVLVVHQRYVAAMLPGRAMPIAECEVPNGSLAEWGAAVVEVLHDARKTLNLRPKRVHIVLGPSIALARIVQLPRVSPEKLAGAVQRGVRRYFPAVAERAVVSGRPVSRTRRSPIDVLVSAAAEDVIAVLFAAVERAGASIASCTTTASAYAYVLQSLSTGHSAARSLVIVELGVAEVLHSVDGAVASVRRVAVPESDVERVATSISRCFDDLGEPQCVFVAARGEMRAVIEAALAARGREIGVWPAPMNDVPSSPNALAGRAATRSIGPQLLAPAFVSRLATRNRRTSIGLLVATAAMILSAMFADLHGDRRELDRLRVERARIHAAVVRASRLRDSVQFVSNQLEVAEHFGERTPSLTNVFASLAGRLPDATYLTHLNMSGDTLTLAGASDDAASAFDALRQVPWVRGVHALAPIRRATDVDSTIIDRFEVALLLKDSEKPGLAR